MLLSHLSGDDPEARHVLPATDLSGPPADLDGPVADAASATPADQLAAQRARWLLDRLPDRYREVLTLRFLRGYSIKETARAMGIAENHAKVLQYRAVQKAAALG